MVHPVVKTIGWVVCALVVLGLLALFVVLVIVPLFVDEPSDPSGSTNPNTLESFGRGSRMGYRGSGGAAGYRRNQRYGGGYGGYWGGFYRRPWMPWYWRTYYYPSAWRYVAYPSTSAYNLYGTPGLQTYYL